MTRPPRVFAPTGFLRGKPFRKRRSAVYHTSVSFTQRQALTTLFFAAGLFAQICINAAGNSVGNYLIAHLREAGLAPMAAAGVLSVYSAVNIAGRLPAGADVRKVLRLGLLGTGVSLLTVPLPATPFSAILFALFFGLSMMGPMTQVMNCFGVAHYSQIIGVQNMVATFAKTLTNLAAGQTRDRTGSYGLFFGYVGLASLTASLWCRIVKPPACKQRPSLP